MPTICNYVHRPATGTPFYHYPHPSCGQGFWYAHELRQAAVLARDNHQQNDPLLVALKQNRLWPCPWIIRRWRNRRQQEGHSLPYHKTGNSRATVLCGLKIVQLSWLMSVFPQINANEINVFLYHANGQVRFYHPSQIYQAQYRIGLSRKRSSRSDGVFGTCLILLEASIFELKIRSTSTRQLYSLKLQIEVKERVTSQFVVVTMVSMVTLKN